MNNFLLVKQTVPNSRRRSRRKERSRFKSGPHTTPQLRIVKPNTMLVTNKLSEELQGEVKQLEFGAMRGVSDVKLVKFDTYRWLTSPPTWIRVMT